MSSPPPQFDLKAGMEPIPGCRLIKRIGRGGFGEVWDAQNIQDDSRLALKFLDCKHQPASLVVNEIKLLIQLRDLQHDNLLQYYSVTASKNIIILTMELAEGSLNDLHYIYRMDHKSHVPSSVLINLMSQAASGLDFIAQQKLTQNSMMAQHGMQHCDIKPSNLLLLSNKLKIADFGLSGPQLWNAKGKAFGTPLYAPPELYEGKANTRTDQFSLAVTYVELRTGQYPYPMSTDGSFPNVSPDLSMLPESERPVVAQALSPQWLNRFNSCQDFVDALVKVVVPSSRGLPYVKRSSSHGSYRR
ncbi:MAG: protein kinase [Planctomycetia bacterium]|nr:protein kinase [Planctomycetia bacterium]